MTDANHSLPTGANDRTKLITLSGRDLTDARRLLALLAKEEERNTVSELARIALERRPTSPELLANRAREILIARQRRGERFGQAMFGEPAWDMLLLLYATEGSTRQTSGRLAELSGGSRSTALRWIDYLVDEGLFARYPHPTDKRMTFVRLTAKGRELLEAYLTETFDDLTD